MACPGSVALSEQCPRQPASIHAAWGTVAHGLGEEVLTGKLDEMGLMAKVGEVVECDGHDVEITDEMVETVLFYRDTVRSIVDEIKADHRMAQVHEHVEVRVRIASIDENLWGTADFVVYRKGHKLIVIDFKGGKGKPVEVEENPQLGLYGLGALETLAGPIESFEEIELVVVQPRCTHADGQVRRWVASREWLKQFRADAHAAVLETRKPDAKIVAGTHCRWCPAKAVCPAIHDAAQLQAQADFSAIAPTEAEVKAGTVPSLPRIKLLDAQQISKALDWRDAIEDWFGAVEAHAAFMLENGQDVPGYKLVEGRSVRSWADETGESAVVIFGSEFGEKVYAPKKPLSPSQMEKLVGKRNKERLDALIVKPAGKLKVAKASDARRLAPTSAQRDFDPLDVPAPATLPAPIVKAVELEALDPFADPLSNFTANDTSPMNHPSAMSNLEEELLGPTVKKREPMWP